MNQETVILKFWKAHGDRYLYTNVSYTNIDTPVEIICREHGAFRQTPYKHAQGQGCPLCGKMFVRSLNQKNMKTASNFVRDALSVHGNRWNYELVEYTGAHQHVTIVCQKHGHFIQTPRNHLNGNGCPRCSTPYRSSRRCDAWLDSLSIDLVREYRVPENRKLVADGYARDTHTVYLFHGDYWHGNPKRYPSSSVNSHNKKTFGSLYEKTLTAEQSYRDLGYGLVTIWESDWVATQRTSKRLPSLLFRENGVNQTE